MDESFRVEYQNELNKVWHWYDDKFKDGLIYQSSFSDWQDTTNREGYTFLLNLFYYMAGTALGKDLEGLKKKIKESFFDGKVFLSLKSYGQVSVEGNLFAILDENFLTTEEKEALWENLKSHPIIALDQAIGRCSYPDWPSHDLAWHIKLANLKRYHGSLSWSWLMGLGLKTCLYMNDQKMLEMQLAHIEKLLLRDGEVYEVYDPEKNFLPWGSWLIKSEHPFAWGAGYLVHAFKLI